MPKTISFGAWLRQQRRALDLTQKAFAAQVGCAEITVRRMEAGEYKPSSELALVLFEKLGIPESERPEWVRFARGLVEYSNHHLTSSSREHKTNLPIPLTSFIGREKELKEVAELLLKSRLVTLTGSGGVGKTRLAIQVVPDVLERFPDGVWFLDLAPLSDPGLVPHVVATTLGLIEQQGRSPTMILTDFWHSRHALFILDNCEHLIQACSQLTETLLLACPKLYILTTSREALRTAGEIPYRVPSLEIPKADVESDVSSLAKIEAVRLFTKRAAVASPSFTISQQNALAIAQICQRLDGIPLALELAAARVNVLTVKQISERLDDRFNLLSRGSRSALPRHQTLHAMIEWSYDLLAQKERLLFHRLAIFMDGWTLEAAEQVCVGDGIESNDILDLLSQLVDKSLVSVENIEDENHYPTGESLRYRMLETIRQFAGSKLTESGEEEQFQTNRLDYFLQWAETAQPQLYSQLAWLKRLEAEHNNVRAALQWAKEHGAGERGLRLATALGSLWVECGHVTEGWEWFEVLLQTGDELPLASRAKSLKGAGNLAAMQGYYAIAEAMLRKSVQFSRVLGEKLNTAATLNILGFLKIHQGEHQEAKLILEESLELYQESETGGKALALLRLGTVVYLQGDYIRAQALYEESLTLAQKHDNRLLMAWVLKHLGNLAQRQGNAGKAAELLERSLALFQEFRHVLGLIAYLEGMAELAGLKDQQERLVRLFGAAAEFHTKLGIMPFSAEQVEYERQLALARTDLGLNLFDMAWEAGRQMSLDEAVTYALTESQ
jgi:predicted ATPase/DNA-binding XRE family transcriptional regulator